MAEQRVELAPSESKQVSFEAVPNEAKAFQVSIDGLTGKLVASYPVVFTSVKVNDIVVQISSGWWGTNYYAVTWHHIVWNAAHRVPVVEGSGSGEIKVTWQLVKGSTRLNGGYGTTPQTREPTGAMDYYFPPGTGAVGEPYAGSMISFGLTPPVTGTYQYVVNVKALAPGGIVVGDNTFEGTVQLG